MLTPIVLERLRVELITAETIIHLPEVIGLVLRIVV